ncbi:MAG: redoxin family protein [Cyclobacteriaceae bacterium]|nr:redoxin family protein [Cyclobacteriaceae bacterium]
MFRLFIIVCFFCTESFGQSLEQVMEDYFVAMGGENQIYKIKSTRETSYNWFRRNSEDNPEAAHAIKTMAILLKPHFKRFVSFDKKGNWNNEFYYNDKGSVMAMGDFIQRDSKTIDVSLCAASDLLYWYQNKKLAFIGEATIDKNRYYAIKRENKASSEVFFFNKETHLLEAKKSSDWPDKVEYYKDYRSTNLILQPFLFEIFNGDEISYRQQTVEFEFNPDVDNKIFYFNQKEYEERNRPKSKYQSVRLNANETNLKDLIKANFEGKRVFVDMWATWCGPCKKEFREYDSAYYSIMETYNIDLLYLSIDKDADKKIWERDVDKLGLKGYHVRANKKLVESLQAEIFDGNVITIPRYILIDQTGSILSKNFLRPSDPEFSKMIKETFE